MTVTQPCPFSFTVTGIPLVVLACNQQQGHAGPHTWTDPRNATTKLTWGP